MNKILTIAKHEFRMTAANKAFVILTILGPFLLIGVTVLPDLLSSSTDSIKGTRIGIVGGDEKLLEGLGPSLKSSGFIAVLSKTEKELKEQVLRGDVKGYLRIPDNYMRAGSFDYCSKSGSEILIYETVGGILGQLIFSLRLEDTGFSRNEVEELSRRPSIQVIQIDKDGGEKKDRDFTELIFTCIGFMMLIYMTVLLYGQIIGRSVVSEKTSKTVEIMLSSVRPVDLLYGKILGIGLAGILQYGIWIAMASGVAFILGPALNVSIPATLTAENLFFLILFFILGFFLYSSAYAAIGSGAEDEAHFNQLSIPLLVVLVIPMTMVVTFVQNPDAGYVKFLSFFPLTASMVMLPRIIVSTPPVWEILVSIVILVLSIFATVAGASKIFRVGILMTGKRRSLKEILKWMRVS